jgi:hypothetical protein
MRFNDFSFDDKGVEMIVGYLMIVFAFFFTQLKNGPYNKYMSLRINYAPELYSYKSAQ